jgi:hypothetical protein
MCLSLINAHTALASLAHRSVHPPLVRCESIGALKTCLKRHAFTVDRKLDLNHSVVRVLKQPLGVFVSRTSDAHRPHAPLELYAPSLWTISERLTDISGQTRPQTETSTSPTQYGRLTGAKASIL